MKYILLLLSILVFSLNCYAERPSWTYGDFPKSCNNTCTNNLILGIGKTKEEARVDALRQMFLMAITREGASVNSDDMFDAIQKGVDFKVISYEYSIPLDIICTPFFYQKGPEEWECYMLCQIPVDVDRITPIFDNSCVDCDKKPKNPYIGYSFVPGMAQIKKGSVAKGSCFIVGEIAFIGGIVVSECMRASYINKLKSTHNTTLHMKYTQNANNWAIARNVCIGGAVAVYVWNVIDGIVAKKKIRCGDFAYIDIAPYAGFDNGGLAVNVQF